MRERSIGTETQTQGARSKNIGEGKTHPGKERIIGTQRGRNIERD